MVSKSIFGLIMYYLDINLTTRKQERPLNTVTAHITLISDTFQDMKYLSKGLRRTKKKYFTGKQMFSKN